MKKIKEMMTLKRIIVLVIVLFFIVFACLNFDRVVINMLFFKISIPLFFLIIILGGIGFITGFLFKQNQTEE